MRIESIGPSRVFVTPRSLEVSLIKPSASQCGSPEIGSPQVRFRQVCSYQYGLLQPRIPQRGPFSDAFAQQCSVEISTAQPCRPEIRSVEASKRKVAALTSDAL